MQIRVNLSRGEKSGWLRGSVVLACSIKPILEAMVKINQIYLRTHSGVPPLYRSGVVYQTEPDDGQEEFACIEPVYHRGWGDCDDLVPIRVAELRHAGELAMVRVQWKKRPDGRKLFHIVVRRANGRIEDPSRILGM